jgi:hypothetical protein
MQSVLFWVIAEGYDPRIIKLAAALRLHVSWTIGYIIARIEYVVGVRLAMLRARRFGDDPRDVETALMHLFSDPGARRVICNEGLRAYIWEANEAIRALPTRDAICLRISLVRSSLSGRSTSKTRLRFYIALRLFVVGQSAILIGRAFYPNPVTEYEL